MTAELIIALIIITTLIILVLTRVNNTPCRCKCCKEVCVCGCRTCEKPALHMEITGPYELPEEPRVGAKIVMGVEAQPAMIPSRTSHVGTYKNLPPRVLLYTEPLYSQNGEGNSINIAPADSDNAPHEAVETFVDHINNVRRVYLHYTNWCGYCKQMKPVYASVKDSLKDTGIEFYEIDEDLAKTPGVNSYPTILMIDEHGFRHQYPGQIDFESLRAWCVTPIIQQIVH